MISKILGHITGKEWGSPSGEPWIALHGWLDNCGSFDTLLPHFPEDHRIIAIDMPGHGFSSHLPAGNLYDIKYCTRIGPNNALFC